MQADMRTEPGRIQFRPGRAGFTLIEVIFATLAFTVIVLVMKMTFSGALTMRNRLESRMEWENRVTVGLTILKKDLEGMIVSGGALAGEILADPSGGMGQNGGQMEFFTTTGIISDLAPWGDIQRVRYSLGQPRIGNFVINSSTNLGFGLLRDVQRNIAAQIQDVPETTQVLDRVEAMTFQLFDGVTWLNSWDSTTSDPAMPLAVRVTLQLHMNHSTFEDQRLTMREILVPIHVTKPAAAETDESAESDDQPPAGQSAGL